MDQWPAPQPRRNDFPATLHFAAQGLGLVRKEYPVHPRAHRPGQDEAREQAEIDKAKADGRWDRAYQGQTTAQVPEDLQRALDAEPAAKAAFEALKSQPRYHILHQLMIAQTEKTRATRIARFIAYPNDEAE